MFFYVRPTGDQLFLLRTDCIKKVDSMLYGNSARVEYRYSATFCFVLWSWAGQARRRGTSFTSSSSTLVSNRTRSNAAGAKNLVVALSLIRLLLWYWILPYFLSRPHRIFKHKLMNSRTVCHCHHSWFGCISFYSPNQIFARSQQTVPPCRFPSKLQTKLSLVCGKSSKWKK